QTSNLEIFSKLKSELSKTDSSNLVNWSKHFKYENPSNSETFNQIVNQMGNHFNVKVMQTRLNYYPDNTTYKPLHRDQHAYLNESQQRILENFTMGASFGASRSLD